MKDTESHAVEALGALLRAVPAITVLGIEPQNASAAKTADVLVRIEAAGQLRTLVCEVKSSGQPRYVRAALLQLRSHTGRDDQTKLPMVIAPYLSPQSQNLCRQAGAGFLDFIGNAHLSFDGIYIDRQIPGKPARERRELGSLFTPKSAQVLRILLRDPDRAWRVTELAAAAGVSVGHVSNVRKRLLDREWALANDDGIYLSSPDALLDEWANAYRAPAGRQMNFYTTLHGAALEAAVRPVLHVGSEDGQAMLASYSAAQWLAPYARTGTHYIYADTRGLERLQAAMDLTTASKGQNVVVTLPDNEGLFRDSIEPAPGVVCTSPVQTYLDLVISGERGMEAANHLRKEMLAWQKD